MNYPVPLTSTFLLRLLEDSVNLLFGTPLFYIVMFWTAFGVICILKRLFTIFR